MLHIFFEMCPKFPQITKYSSRCECKHRVEIPGNLNLPV